MDYDDCVGVKSKKKNLLELMGVELDESTLEDIHSKVQKVYKSISTDFENEEVETRSININFKTEEDVLLFAEVTGCTITDKTKSLWFPPKKNGNHLTKAWVDE